MKPAIDLLMACQLLVILAPVFVLISLLLIWMNKPVLFRHLRPGQDGRLFTMYKFTTMTGDDDPDSFPFGRILRKTSLDELPQLLNVLRGEMSFIGPRPLLPEYLSGYTARQHRRHDVKPGITGWAQVSGRNALTLEEKVRLDLFYVEHVGFLLDLKILFKTFLQLLRWGEADFHSLPYVKPEPEVG